MSTKSAKSYDSRMGYSELIALIFLISVASWAFVLSGAGVADIHVQKVWDLSHFYTIFLMWWGMMVAMMLPSITPFLLLHRRVFVSRSKDSHRIIFTSICLLVGYFFVWGIFSLGATFLQWWWSINGAMQMHKISTPEIASFIFILAGLYQLSPLKAHCLESCKSPLTFVLQNWRPGMSGALYMGVKHGLFCLGCCWAIMLLLFVAGVMNFYWIAALTLYVFLERYIPLSTIILNSITASILIAWGVIHLILF